MLALGFQGSPRKKGNTDYLLSLFMNEVEKSGVQTKIINISKVNVRPCIGCNTCEKQGFCIFEDDDMPEMYSLLRRADIIVVASPIYFYNVPSQMKAFIDRSQALWSRKYKLKIKDPYNKFRKGFFLSVGATKGQNLFEGVSLTARYFFDAVSASYEGILSYRRVEEPGDIEKVDGVENDVKKSVEVLLSPLLNRKRIIFACVGNTCRSQMAGAFAQLLGGEKFDVATAGSLPEKEINPTMVEAMQEKGIDMAHKIPQSLDNVIKEQKPDILITMGCGEQCPVIPGTKVIDWSITDPAGKDIDFMRKTRDEIEQKVKELIEVE